MEDGIINEEHQNRDHRFEKDAENEGREEENVLQFLDSLDSYLTHMDSLSSTLRRGWLDLASARYSMGTSRVTSTLFDLKLHPAATTLQVSQLDKETPQQDPMEKEPHFGLARWSSSPDEMETESHKEYIQKNNFNSLLRHREISEYSGTPAGHQNIPASPGSPPPLDDHVQKERSKSLSVFGTLVSPKLRESQVSFETALETLVEIANMRSMVLSAYARIQRDKSGSNH